MYVHLHEPQHAVRHPASPVPHDLADSFARRFTIQAASTPDLVRQAHRLRYQVYCIENSFEDPACFPDGVEYDEFDPHSLHCLLFDQSCQALAGTVRLILPRPEASCSSLPIQRLCRHPLPHDQHLLRRGTAEISRFAISKTYRRLVREQRSREESILQAQDLPSGEQILTCTALALIKGAVRMSNAHGITELFAVMEPALLRLLERFAICFAPLGPLVEHHGRRQPCYVNLPAMLQQLHRERPDVWSVITYNDLQQGADILPAVSGCLPGAYPPPWVPAGAREQPAWHSPSPYAG